MRAALVLAAGASRRFGTRDKRRESLLGRPLIAHVLDRVSESDARRTLVVTDRPLPNLHRTIRQVRAEDAHLGMGASLIAGLKALRPIEREVLIFLADVPFAGVPHGLRLRAGDDAVRLMHRGEPGHPLLVRTAVARRLVRLGDKGIAGAVVAGRLRILPGVRGNILDIDTPAALARLRHRIARSGGALRLQNKDLGCSKSLNGLRRSRR